MAVRPPASTLKSRGRRSAMKTSQGKSKKDMLQLHSEWAGIIRALPARAPTPAAAQPPQSPPTYRGT